MNRTQRLVQTIGKSTRCIIGLMSGMSMDGVDLACATISGEFPSLDVQIRGTHFSPYSKDLRHRLLKAQNGSTADVSELNFVIAREFARCVQHFLARHPDLKIDAIGSHGQTLHHSSQNGVSLQIGSPSLIAELTGIATVGNFRVRDMIAGGRGAPLVCLADYVLFRNTSTPVALNNLGSMANLTIVGSHVDDLLAFDTGPANFAIDHFARRAPDNPWGIDRDGKWSAKGRVIPQLLAQMMKAPFFEQAPPKSAGYTDFGNLDLIAAGFNANPEDLVRTSVEFCAASLAQAYRRFVFPKFPNLKLAWFSGGGVHNPTLMKRIAELLPELEIRVFEKTFADAKEALAFAILANETLSGRAGSFHSTTGVCPDVVLGEIAV